MAATVAMDGAAAPVEVDDDDDADAEGEEAGLSTVADSGRFRPTVPSVVRNAMDGLGRGEKALAVVARRRARRAPDRCGPLGCIILVVVVVMAEPVFSS